MSLPVSEKSSPLIPINSFEGIKSQFSEVNNRIDAIAKAALVDSNPNINISDFASQETANAKNWNTFKQDPNNKLSSREKNDITNMSNRVTTSLRSLNDLANNKEDSEKLNTCVRKWALISFGWFNSGLNQLNEKGELVKDDPNDSERQIPLESGDTPCLLDRPLKTMNSFSTINEQKERTLTEIKRFKSLATEDDTKEFLEKMEKDVEKIATLYKVATVLNGIMIGLIAGLFVAGVVCLAVLAPQGAAGALALSASYFTKISCSTLVPMVGLAITSIWKNSIENKLKEKNGELNRAKNIA